MSRAAYHQDRRAAFRVKGLCPNCGRECFPMKTCLRCRTHRFLRAKSFMEQGLCKRCGKCPPIEGTKRCSKCAAREGKAHRKWYDKKHPRRTCPRCLQHTTRKRLCFACSRVGSGFAKLVNGTVPGMRECLPIDITVMGDEHALPDLGEIACQDYAPPDDPHSDWRDLMVLEGGSR